MLVPLLREAGHDVVSTDLGLYRGGSYSEGAPPPDGVEVREVDPNQLEGFDAIIAHAALSSDPLGDLDPELTYRSTIKPWSMWPSW